MIGWLTNDKNATIFAAAALLKPNRLSP